MKYIELFATSDKRHVYAVAEISLDGRKAYSTALLENGKTKDCHEYPSLEEAREAIYMAVVLCTDRNMQLQRAGVA